MTNVTLGIMRTVRRLARTSVVQKSHARKFMGMLSRTGATHNLACNYFVCLFFYTGLYFLGGWSGTFDRCIIRGVRSTFGYFGYGAVRRGV